MRLDPKAASTEIELLKRSAGSPVGNLRVKEAHLLEAEQLAKMIHVGATMEEILNRDATFLEVADHFSRLASGSSGLRGDWPKVALTQSKDGLWYPAPMVDDQDSRAHVIGKLLRSSEPTDRRILEAEAGYLKVTKDFGLNVESENTFGDGVLVIAMCVMTHSNARTSRCSLSRLESSIVAPSSQESTSHFAFW
ncbi:hypothetical protein AAFG13_35435 [Bradyrhizobium sp. B124]|uniref:hypothetical protein n=1 Tax=Bradyrhizobium sp. B124 TaxID=3140245 RepID=UPI0031833BE4